MADSSLGTPEFSIEQIMELLTEFSPEFFYDPGASSGEYGASSSQEGASSGEHGASSSIAGVAVSKITEDSRKVGPGTIFVARCGEKSDGRRFTGQAIASGAALLLCERGVSVELGPRIEVADLYAAWGKLARALLGNPEAALRMVGITGTNGKTSTATLVSDALLRLGHVSAQSGTLGFFIGGERQTESLTTPQPDQLAALLARAKESGAQEVVMEVSSHALSQGRIKGLAFSVVAFSNLSQDHLDYHGDLQSYQQEKEKLFFDYQSEAAVVNLDDAVGAQLATRLQAQAKRVLGVSTENQRAKIFLTKHELTPQGIQAQVLYQNPGEASGVQEATLRSPLIGRHNLDNLGLSLGILLALGVELRVACEALESGRGAAGRMERVGRSKHAPTVLVDYAHTPDALERALGGLRELGAHDLRVVFGCGGDRDRGKRPLMGKAACQADKIWVTSDNPRTEDPQAIIDEILPGLAGEEERTFIVPDRRSAIREALAGATENSVILIAGKGHEDYQILGNEVIHFDDREEAQQALSSLGWGDK